MSYIGNTPTQQNFVAGADQFSGNGSTVAFTLSRSVNTVFDIFVTVSNVPQDPFTAYTVSGNTLTFDSAPPLGTNNIDVVYRATNVQTFVPSPGVSPSVGNLNFIGTGNRITGDFSNATVANRVMFQTSTVNGNTSFGLIPNGTSVTSNFRAFNNSDPTNCGWIDIQGNTAESAVRSGINGTGTYVPMTFYTGGSERARIDTSGNFQFNSGYGSVATAYGCRAWVNFNGTANTNLSGTYSQSGTTVTVTATAHGLIAGNIIYADITTGTGVDGVYTVATVTDANTFTYTAGTSLTTSGNITLVRSTIRGSGNVSSVADNGVGDYTVNFTTAMPDANYGYACSGSIRDAIDNAVVLSCGADRNVAPTSSAIRINTVYINSGVYTFIDGAEVCTSIFR